jgi:hypothetical protein
MSRTFDMYEDEAHGKTTGSLENNGYVDRDTMWAVFAAVIDNARWMGMSDKDIKAAFKKGMR